MSQTVARPFPFCPVEDATVGAGTLHPISTTYLTSLKWYRKVKSWTVTIDMTWGVFVIPTEVTLDSVAYASERYLVCLDQSNPPGVGRRAEGDDDMVVGVDTRFVDFEFFLLAPWGQPLTPNAPTPGDFNTDALRYNGGSTYYPQFLFRMRGGGDGVTDTDISTWNDGVASSVGTGYITFDGVAVAGYAFSIGDLASVDISPTEYWEYRPSSGGNPVYDSATGTQINPNVVID